MQIGYLEANFFFFGKGVKFLTLRKTIPNYFLRFSSFQTPLTQCPSNLVTFLAQILICMFSCWERKEKQAKLCCVQLVHQWTSLRKAELTSSLSRQWMLERCAFSFVSEWAEQCFVRAGFSLWTQTCSWRRETSARNTSVCFEMTVEKPKPHQ